MNNAEYKRLDEQEKVSADQTRSDTTPSQERFQPY